MQQLEGFANPRCPRNVCKLKKALYVLKQTRKIWNQKLDEGLKRFELARSKFDTCVFVGFIGQGQRFQSTSFHHWIHFLEVGGSTEANTRSATGAIWSVREDHHLLWQQWHGSSEHLLGRSFVIFKEKKNKFGSTIFQHTFLLYTAIRFYLATVYVQNSL